jgi:hypothetical protein
MTEQFGKKAKDTITGFTGIVIGYCQYISGCSQCLLAPEVSKEGNFRESCWFDAQRIKILKSKTIVLINEKSPGPDKAAPII